LWRRANPQRVFDTEDTKDTKEEKSGFKETQILAFVLRVLCAEYKLRVARTPRKIDPYADEASARLTAHVERDA